jgi:hypothetical protein
VSIHSKAPWVVYGNERSVTVWAEGSGASVCTVARKDVANANLISAAPDMLDVLQRCAEVLDDYSDVLDGDDGHPRPNRAMSLLQDVEAVIAKAERAK